MAVTFSPSLLLLHFLVEFERLEVKIGEEKQNNTQVKKAGVTSSCFVSADMDVSLDC